MHRIRRISAISRSGLTYLLAARAHYSVAPASSATRYAAPEALRPTVSRGLISYRRFPTLWEARTAITRVCPGEDPG